MSRPSLRWLLSPPVRLRALPDGWASALRILWLFACLAAVAAVTLGTVQSVRDAYEVRPAFRSLGLDYDIEENGDVSVEILRGTVGPPPAQGPNRLIGVDGIAIGGKSRAADLARRLRAARGPLVSLDLRNAHDQLVRVRQKRDLSPQDPTAKRAVDLTLAARLATGLLACGALLSCSFLLARRRPNDPVALLFAFAFAGMAATIDPPLKMWMAMGWPISYDFISGAWFYLLLIALAVFPDGVFAPRPLRWLLLAGLLLAVAINLPSIGTLSAFIGLAALLVVLVGQVFRYRRLPPGIERQQIKWAAFGFAVGLLLILAAFVLLMLLPDHPSKRTVVLGLTTVVLFSLGMAAIPFGLLVALTHFRLWEADTVITRSAAYAVVTLVVGVVWAVSSDLLKMVIEEVIGRESQTGATTAGAVIAAGIFSPTQSFVLGWTRKRFGDPLDRMRGAASRMKKWALTETPAEVATRALAIIDDVMHPSASAIVLDTALNRELIAARDTASADSPELVEKLSLTDEEGPVGTLLLGRRSDRNRYNRQQLGAVEELIPALAEALRIARSHHSRESEMQDRLNQMAARLAQLEGGGRRPEPA